MTLALVDPRREPPRDTHRGGPARPAPADAPVPGAARAMRGRVLRLRISSDSPVPLVEQIYGEVRAAIVARRLRTGDALPSSRALAVQLGVSRSTVMLAYDRLRDEGFLSMHQGAATRVGEAAASLAAVGRPGGREQPEAPPLRTAGRLRGAMDLERAAHELFAARGARPFRTGVAAFDLFPMDLWGRFLSRTWRAASPRALGYGDPRGYLPLREAIADHIAAARGVRCAPEQVIVTAGAQNALSLCALALLDPGDAVWMEDPGYPGTRSALEMHAARIVPVPVDAHGFDVELASRTDPAVRGAFVTPGKQAHLGVVMSAARRRALLEWAARTQSFVVEDDYDADFHFADTSPPPLCTADESGRVLYIGTYSKVVFPALRLGFVVVPQALVDAFGAARFSLDGQSPTLEQATLAAFMRSGHFDRHVRRIRQIYAERRAVLVAEIERRLGGVVTVPDAAAGMSLTVWLPDGLSDVEVARAAMEAGIESVPLSRFAIAHAVRPGLVLGLSGLSERDIESGVARLAAAIERVRGSSAR